jgi:integrase
MTDPHRVRHEVSKNWLELRKARKSTEHSIRLSACNERQYVDFLRDLGVDLLSEDFKHYLKFLSYKTSLGRAEETVRGYKTTIQNIYHYVDTLSDKTANLSYEIIKGHSLRGYSFAGGFERQALTIEEVEKLLGSFKYLRNKLMAFTVFCTGLRNKAIRNLRLDDIDYEQSTIRVRNPKGGGPAYSAAMPQILSLKLKQWEKVGRKSHSSPMEHNYVFPSKKGIGKLGCNASFGIPVKKAAERAGIQDILGTTTETRNGKEITRKWSKVTPHALRHTYITFLKNSGAPSEARQQAANHSDMSTTKRYEHTEGEYDNIIRSIFDSQKRLRDF